jgi:hypothetical protein
VPADDPEAHKAHERYVDAINSNDDEIPEPNAAARQRPKRGATSVRGAP